MVLFQNGNSKSVDWMRKSATNELEEEITLFKWHIKLRFRIENIQIEAKIWGIKGRIPFMEDEHENWMRRIKNLASGSLGHSFAIFCIFSCTISLFIDYAQEAVSLFEGEEERMKFSASVTSN